MIVANPINVNARLNWKRLWTEQMLMNISYQSRDSSGQRVSAGIQEIHTKLMDIFFDPKASKGKQIGAVGKGKYNSNLF